MAGAPEDLLTVLIVESSSGTRIGTEAIIPNFQRRATTLDKVNRSRVQKYALALGVAQGAQSLRVSGARSVEYRAGGAFSVNFGRRGVDHLRQCALAAAPLYLS